MPNFAEFLSFVLLSTFTPGPNNIMAMTNAGRLGFIKGIRFSVGVFVGEFIIAVLCMLLGSALYSVMPALMPIMVWVGAGYILWLAWHIWRDAPGKGGSKRDTNSVLAGALLQFVNPKVILYSVTAATTFVLPYQRAPLPLLLLSLMMSFIGFCASMSWALFGSVFQRAYQRWRKPFNAVLALLLVLCALSLLLHR